jgi:hypothetical protein
VSRDWHPRRNHAPIAAVEALDMPLTPRPSTGCRLATAVAVTIGVALVAAGCAASPRASAEPTAGAISHPTAPTDLVLRVFVGGGFVPPGFLATEAPAFSLFGDGTIIYREQGGPLPTPANGVAQGAAFRMAKLDEARVQALLADALDVGGLRTAQATYTLPVADAPTTTFTLSADGHRVVVSVNGLGLVAPAATDAAAIDALAGLRDRLLAYGAGLSGSQPWEADRYRAYLLDGITGTTAIRWPWHDVSPSTWTNVSDGDASLAFPTRILTRAEVEALGLGPLAGGAMGIVVVYPPAGGKLYGVSLRPLLPDETS